MIGNDEIHDDDPIVDDRTGEDAERAPAPWWYWLVAVGAVLFELVGCYAFYLQLTVDPASLPIDQRALAETLPMLTLVAYGVAVASGLLGAVALLARLPWASAALLLSLVAMAVQFGSLLLSPAARGSTPSDLLAGPIVLLLVAYALWQFAKIARRKGWIG